MEGAAGGVVPNDLKIRSMRELVWRAERLGYKRKGGERNDNVHDLVEFIAEKTRQKVSLSKIEQGEEEQEREKEREEMLKVREEEKQRRAQEKKERRDSRPKSTAPTPLSTTGSMLRASRRPSRPSDIIPAPTRDEDEDMSAVVKGLVRTCSFMTPPRKGSLRSGEYTHCFFST